MNPPKKSDGRRKSGSLLSILMPPGRERLESFGEGPEYLMASGIADPPPPTYDLR